MGLKQLAFVVYPQYRFGGVQDRKGHMIGM